MPPKLEAALTEYEKAARLLSISREAKQLLRDGECAARDLMSADSKPSVLGRLTRKIYRGYFVRYANLDETLRQVEILQQHARHAVMVATGDDADVMLTACTRMQEIDQRVGV